MRRKEVRQLKRAVTGQSDGAAITVLLERSVRFGHKRLSLFRCFQAEQLGIRVADDVLAYCRKLAEQMPAEELGLIFQRARGALA